MKKTVKTYHSDRLGRVTIPESVSGYLLRDIPADLWNQAKHRSVDEGKSLREMILEALRQYLEKK